MFDKLSGPLTILYIIVIVSLTSVMITALIRVEKGHSTQLRLIFQGTQFLKLATVLVIIISATYLAIADKLDQGIVVILSGVAGFVLGGLRDKKPSDETTTKGQ